jgi:hypothetical protein
MFGLPGCKRNAPAPAGTFELNVTQLPLRPFVGQKSGVTMTFQAANIAGPVDWTVTGQPENKTKPWTNVPGDVTYVTSGVIPPGILPTVGITIRVVGVDKPTQKTHDSSHGIVYDLFGRTITAPNPDVTALMHRYKLDFGAELDFSGGDGDADVYLDDQNLTGTDKVRFQAAEGGGFTAEYPCDRRENFTGCQNAMGAVKIRLSPKDFHLLDSGKINVLLPIRPAPTPQDQQPMLKQVRLEVR